MQIEFIFLNESGYWKTNTKTTKEKVSNYIKLNEIPF